jgi:hypothetical protein
MTCSHTFLASGACSKCGTHIRRVSAEELLGKAPRVETEGVETPQLELTRLAAILADAIDLLRDWEDYDPADPECTWKARRDEFLREHEAEGR